MLSMVRRAVDGGSKPIRVPRKTYINLNMRERRKEERVKLWAGILIIVISAVLVGKFAVVDRFALLYAAEQAQAQIHSEYVRTAEALADYEKVLTEYRAYSRDWADDGDIVVSRTDVLDMMEREMLSRGTLRSVDIQGNAVAIKMSGMSLREISEMMDRLKEYDFVEAAELDMAETERDMPADRLSFSVNISLGEVDKQ